MHAFPDLVHLLGEVNEERAGLHLEGSLTRAVRGQHLRHIDLAESGVRGISPERSKAM